jgi:hippurate hydrolase
MPLGSFGIRPGPFFAAADLVRIEVEGRGGHAAKPHETVDTTLVAAHVVTALQSIASRNADPTEQVVVSITSFRTSSDAYNVIPQKVELRGTVRSLNTGLQDMAEANLTRIAENTAAAFGAVARVSYKRNYPAMVNAAAQTDFAAEVARAVAGDCAEAPLVMGAEDFSFMLNARPGAYILVGNGETASLHHPEYDFDDAVIPAGCSWWAEVVERRMPIG